MAAERSTTTSQTQEVSQQRAEQMGRTMRQVRDETSEALRNIDSLPPHQTLQVLGGIIALGVGTLLFFFGIAGVAIFGPALAGFAIFWWIMDVIFGFLVLMAFGMARRAPLNGAILGVVFGLLLAIFGGVSGLVGGILAMVGFGWGYWVESGRRLPMMGTPPPSA